MKVGITGAKGFIGGHLKKTLETKRGVRVYGFSRPRFDILNPADVGKFVKGKDVIIHAAAVNRGNDTDVIVGTVIGTYNFIAAIAKLKKKPKIIFLSSVQAEKKTVYGLSKRLAEAMLKDFSERYRASVSIFRIANVFGEGIKPFRHSVVATFSYQLIRGQPLSINPGSRKFHFVYVRDLAGIIAREALRHRRRFFYFQYVKSKNVFTIPQIVSLLKRMPKTTSPRELKTKFERDLHRTYLSYLT